MDTLPAALDDDERRRHGRFRCGSEVDIYRLPVGEKTSGKLADLSLSGCLIRPHQHGDFEPDETVEVAFSLNQLPLRMRGSVRHVREDQSLGIEFTMLTERGKRDLRELILDLARRWKALTEAPRSRKK